MGSLALVGPSWPFRGGIARTTTSLAQALQRRGSLAGFFVPLRQYPRWLYPGGEDRDPGACPQLPYAVGCFSLFAPASWYRLSRQLLRCRPDALVMPYWTAAWAPLAFFLAGRGLPAFAIVHNPHDHGASPWGRWVAWGTLRRFRGFFAHARTVAWQLHRWFPEKPVRVHLLPPPQALPVAKEAARRSLQIPQEAVLFLFFGLVRGYKGVELLLQAAAGLPGEPAWLLAVVGEPWEGGERLQAMVRELGLGSRVRLELRWVAEEETPLWFSAADVVVLPYRRATGSAVASQALAYGLPVVASATGGFLEVLEQGKNGLLVPPGDVGALREALVALLAPGLREQLAAGAKGWGERWSWDSYARALEELVSSTLSAGGRKA